jgi:hypothetical protein
VRIVDEAGGYVGPVLIERVRLGRTADAYAVRATKIHIWYPMTQAVQTIASSL